MRRKWLKLAVLLFVSFGLILLLSGLSISPLLNKTFGQLESPSASIVGSNSMKPTLRRGDIIFLEDVKPAKIQEGDIVMFDLPPMTQDIYNYPDTIVHRVVNIQKKEGMLWFKTAGDATGKDPFMVSELAVRGRYTGRKIPRVGMLFLFFQSSAGRKYAIFLFLVVISLAFLPDAWRAWKEGVKEREVISEEVSSLRKSFEEISRSTKANPPDQSVTPKREKKIIFSRIPGGKAVVKEEEREK